MTLLKAIANRSLLQGNLVGTFRSFSSTPRALIPTYKVAIIGTGPAGFYTGYHLLNKSPKDKFKVQLDFFDRLPSPYGLSRYGVAPDHPEVKNCEDYLNDIMNNDENKDHVRYFGNVNVGVDIGIKDLQDCYHSIVLAYGCVNADNKLDVPGNDLPGVLSARQFVNWYNGHPDFYDKTNPFTPPELEKIEDVTIIGNGNVALDVARILLADPNDHWASTDISSEALNILKTSSVKNVNIVARRGLLESAFTNKEIRELLELNNSKKVKFIPIDPEIYDAITPYLDKLGRVDKRRLSVLEKYAKNFDNNDINKVKTWSLKYLLSPKEFIVSNDNPNLLRETVFTKNKLIHDNLTNESKVVPDNDANPITLKNELVVLSIGYKGSPLNDFHYNDIKMNDYNDRILNKDGRVLSSTSAGETLHDIVYKKGFYTAGWIKKGPKGVIASTMMESFDTADKIIEDLDNKDYTSDSKKIDIIDKLTNVPYVSWDNWLKLDQYELEIGKSLNKSRDKVCDSDQMIKIACK